ncbi:MAG: DUF5711 family protein, partial [Clostridium sp.]|nr:DUF5711 family protein [Clostridium sp.]
PAAWARVTVEVEIRTIYYTDRYVAVITDNVEGGDPYRMRIYGVDGTLILDQTFNFQYSGVNIDGDLILLYNDGACQVYNMNGVQKFSGSFDFTVSKVSAGRFPGTLLVTGPQMMKEIRLQ